uniref:Uncharacterized protein n=1 Tax=Arundo donax TaxID=35708 RepID=A0A0A8YMR3_ARUDO
MSTSTTSLSHNILLVKAIKPHIAAPIFMDTQPFHTTELNIHC